MQTFGEPRNIPSPMTGETVRPRILTFERDGKIYTEAHYYCPSSGQFFHKAQISVQDKSTGKPN
jgi:hypothetical protein